MSQSNNRLPLPLFHIEIPRDIRRDVVVPEEQWVEVTAPSHFRLRLVDPATGKTIRVMRSEENRVVFEAPHYHGDGTRCRVLELQVSVYRQGRAERSFSRLLVPPPSAKAAVKLTLSGDEVRRHPEYRTVLSNGAGAASQLRVGWGEIRSQYDATLAANPNPTCPSDRVNVWARTRCWLQREGYARELDRKCVTRFTADPAGRFARWDFTVPCGMGYETAFVFELALEPGVNVARLRVTRVRAEANDVGDQVRLVFRPDLEWRSFHATTKAYQGLEGLFPARCEPIGRGGDAPGTRGFRFHPYDGDFTMTVENGIYHHEPEWQYSVGHPEEAERGQEGAGDLFSPGWISADLKDGESVELVGAFGEGGVGVARSGTDRAPCGASRSVGLSDEGAQSVPDCALQPEATLGFAAALKEATSLFIVRRDDLKTVIAGYPWFLDWGRDTFIFMRGMIAAGMYDDSLKILQAFAAFEENGTLPNIIYGQTAGNRDTTDAQLWFIRCVEELSKAVSAPGRAVALRPPRPARSARSADPTDDAHDLSIADECKRLLPTCESIVENYLKGTPNGIHVDAESGLVWSPSHFTWMDTNYPACTPRVGYPVEIQALWISALRFLGRTELAEKAKASVIRYFKVPEQSDGRTIEQSNNQNNRTIGYYDCLAAPHGEPAARAVPEDTVRPNQLFLLTLGVLDDPSILRATEELLVPGGIRSLNAGHRLYCGVYAGDEDASRKPAYHNGTVWAWPFPLYAEALAAVGGADGEVALQLLASAVENLNMGTIGHMSEIADGDAPHAQKGCTAQAWSVSELLRVWLKLGGR